MPTNWRFLKGLTLNCMILEFYFVFDSYIWEILKVELKSVQITHWGNRHQYSFHTVEWFIEYYITIKSLLLKGSSGERDIISELVNSIGNHFTRRWFGKKVDNKNK